MAQLDVSEIILDPDFCDNLTVTRRVQVMGDDGRATSTDTIIPIVGVVTAQNGDFIRQTDAEFAVNTIMVHSQTKLRSVTDGNYPDSLQWQGNTYVVKRCNNFSNFGTGFYAAICELLDLAEAP